MEPVIQQLTEQFLQAQIAVRRLQSNHYIDQFASANLQKDKTKYAFVFGSLDQQIDLLEFALSLIQQ